MKISTTRKTKTYSAGDEVLVGVKDIKENHNGNISMQLGIYDGQQMTSTFFYQTIGDPDGKGRYYLEQFLNAVDVPEDMEIDLDYFKGKTFRVVLGENTYQGKTNLTVGSYIAADGNEEENMLPSLLSLEEDVDIAPKASKKKKKTDSTDAKLESGIVREDYTQLLMNDD